MDAHLGARGLRGGFRGRGYSFQASGDGHGPSTPGNASNNGFRGGRGRGRGRGFGNPRTPAPRPTHFLAIPLGTHSILRQRVAKFTDALLDNDPPIDGLEKGIVVDPRRLHFTLGVMSLRGPNDADTEDKRPVQDALDLLKSLKPQILGILNPDGVQQSQTPSQSTFQPLRIPLTTLDILKPEKNGGANVLWVGPDVSVLSGKKSAMIEDQYHSSEIEDLAKLVQVSDLIHQTFKRQGFIVDSRPLKLHCTLVNTAHRKVRGVPFGYQSILASQALRTLRVRDKGTALDRTLLTPKPSSSPFEPIPINLGTWSAREVQICIMGSHGPENEYVSVGGIRLDNLE